MRLKGPEELSLYLSGCMLFRTFQFPGFALIATEYLTKFCLQCRATKIFANDLSIRIN